MQLFSKPPITPQTTSGWHEILWALLSRPQLSPNRILLKTHELRGRLADRSCKSPQILCPSFYHLETPWVAISAPTAAAQEKHPTTPRTTSMQIVSDPPPNFVGVPPPVPSLLGQNFGQLARAIFGMSSSGPPFGRVIWGIPCPTPSLPGQNFGKMARAIFPCEASRGKGRARGSPAMEGSPRVWTVCTVSWLGE